jgi:hypothetical protein
LRDASPRDWAHAWPRGHALQRQRLEVRWDGAGAVRQAAGLQRGAGGCADGGCGGDKAVGKGDEDLGGSGRGSGGFRGLAAERREFDERRRRPPRGADSSDGAGDGSGVRALCASLRARASGLRVLRLRGHAVTGAAAAALAGWLAGVGCRLEELDLGNCGLTDEQLAVSHAGRISRALCEGEVLRTG